MTQGTIELKAGDAAILLHANGDIGLLIPKLDGDDDAEAPEHVALAMAFGIVARIPPLRDMVVMMAESAAERDEADDEAEAAPEVTQ